MNSLVIRYSDSEVSKVQRLIEELKRLKLAFHIREAAPVLTEGELDWSDEYATYEYAMPVLARDWDRPEDDVWNDL